MLPMMTGYVYYEYKKHVIKKEVKRKVISGIDKDELVLLSFKKAEIANKLKWERADEFEYLGEMYDVVEREMIGDSIFYWCWWDHEETKLSYQLNQLLLKKMQHDSESKEHAAQLLSLLKTHFLSNNEEWMKFHEQVISNQYSAIDMPYYSMKYQPLVPPPEIS